MSISFQKLKNSKNALDLYEVNNDTLSRKFSTNNKKFSYKSHLIWLEKILKNRSQIIYLVKFKKNIIGFIRVNKKKSHKELSWGLKKKFRGKNYGKKMLKLFVKKYRSKYKAKINNRNFPSIKICIHAGFTLSAQRIKFNYYKN